MTIAAAVAVFLIVQDRITAAGARRYVDMQRAAYPDASPALSIDDVMGPAIRRSVQQGLLWGGIVLVSGLGTASVLPRRELPRE
jgi:hypothetical protein